MSTNKPTPEGSELKPGDPSTVPASPDELAEHQAKEEAMKSAPKGGGRPYPIQWEYHRYILRDTASRIDTHQLNEIGGQGWELIAVFHLHADINFIFKRMKNI